MTGKFQHIQEIGQLLKYKEETVAVAESATGGLLQYAFSTAENAMQFYQGGITMYNIGQKTMHLNIDPIHAMSVNCVSQKVADQLACNVVKKFIAGWGLSVTGYASPVPESGNQLFAFYSIAYKGEIREHAKITLLHGTPGEVQHAYVDFVLSQFLSVLKN